MKRHLCPRCKTENIRRPLLVQDGDSASAVWTCRHCDATFVQELPDLCFAKAIEEPLLLMEA